VTGPVCVNGARITEAFVEAVPDVATVSPLYVFSLSGWLHWFVPSLMGNAKVYDPTGSSMVVLEMAL